MSKSKSTQQGRDSPPKWVTFSQDQRKLKLKAFEKLTLHMTLRKVLRKYFEERDIPKIFSVQEKDSSN